jgi:hypothetical protein
MCWGSWRGAGGALPPPHNPSKTGVNALLPGEGWGGPSDEDWRVLTPSRRATRAARLFTAAPLEVLLRR